METIGRLTPGTTVAQAQAALDAAWPELKRARTPSGFAGAQRDPFVNTRLVVRSAARGVSQPMARREDRRLAKPSDGVSQVVEHRRVARLVLALQ